MFKKQGTSGLPEVTDNIYGTLSKSRDILPHPQSAVDLSQLLTVDGEGCLNFSIFFCISWT
jgi:hypothetical protein